MSGQVNETRWHLTIETDAHREEEFPDQERVPSRRTASELSSSRKSVKSEPVTPSTLRTRGRPIKPHEPEPFLSIDNLPRERSYLSERSQYSTVSSNPFGRPPPPAQKSPNIIQWQRSMMYSQAQQTATSQGYNQAAIDSGIWLDQLLQWSLTNRLMINTTKGKQPGSGKQALKSPKSSRSSRSASADSSKREKPKQPGASKFTKMGRPRSAANGRSTPNSYLSPNKDMRNPNHHVRSPFKHAVDKPSLYPERTMTPSMEMKERTALATFHISKILAPERGNENRKSAGRLTKGKLKPLYPVENLKGPSIEQCRGIVSDTQSYGPSPSRTLQRRQQIVAAIPNVHEYLYERPHTVESVHQTSAASSVDDNRDNQTDFNEDEAMDSNRSLPDEVLYTTPLTRSELDSQSFAKSRTIDTLEKNNSPEPAEPGMADIEGPAIPSVPQSDKPGDATPPKSGEATPTPRMFVTEVSSKSNIEKLASQMTEGLKLHDQDKNDDSVKDNNENNNANRSKTDYSEGSRPHTAGEVSTRGTSPTKSVRFADDYGSPKKDLAKTKDLKQLRNTKIAKQDRKKSDSSESGDVDILKIEKKEEKAKGKKSKKGSESCKADKDIKSKKDDHDKDDEGKHDNRKNYQQLSTSTGEGNSGNSSDNKSKEKAGETGAETSKGHKKAAIDIPASPTRGSHCSRYEQAMKKKEVGALQVQTVIHGNSVRTILGAESPSCCRSRSGSRSRSASPNRRSSAKSPVYFGSYESFLARDILTPTQSGNSALDVSELSLETSSNYIGSNEFDYTAHKSKVKFLLEGEPQPKETLFIETDDGNVLVKDEENFTFENIELELQNIREAIHDKLEDSDGLDADIEEITQCEETGSQREVTSADSREINDVDSTIDSVRADYTDLIEQYRQRCIQMGSAYGEMSHRLLTPHNNTTNTGHSQRNRYSWLGGKDTQHAHDQVHRNSDTTDKSEFGRSLGAKLSGSCQSIVSDSGHGSSLGNLSERSRSVTGLTPEVPRLDLGSLSAGIGGDSDTDSDTLEDGDDKHLLDLVAEDLPSPKKVKEKEETPPQREEDVTKLTVVATAKTLSKGRKEKQRNRSEPAAPFPPLCFTINARAPVGHLYYFAYGPDMNPNRFSAYLGRQVEERYWALLFGFSLVFNKRGSDLEAGGFTNIEFNPVSSVEGCMYKIKTEDLDVLDKCIGYPQHYEHLVLPVWMSNSNDADNHGVAQYCVPALTYIAQDKWIDNENKLNCDYSVSQCVKSADLLTPEYRDFLTKVTAFEQQAVC